MAVVVMSLLVPPVLATEHTLNPGDSIQQNITDAGNGDTIILNPGTYLEHDIFIEKDIVIRANSSAGGNAANTIIDAEYAGIIFNGDADIVLAIDNLTLQNGHNAYDGGAVNAAHASNLEVTSSVFSNCSADGVGGAIYIMWRTATITATTFENCSANVGGAIGAYYGGEGVVVISSTFENCSATADGGAIAANTTDITSSVFRDCRAENEGGAISSKSSSIISSTFANCSAGFNGGAIDVTDSISVASSAFFHCSAQKSGGAVMSYGNMTVTASTFDTCLAGMNGGAIFSGEKLVTITDTRFENCSATDGGAFSNNGSPVTISATGFENCSASYQGGAVYYYNDRGGPLILDNTTFSGNTAVAGGAVYTGGAVSERATVFIENSIFSDCSATLGGALNSLMSDITISFATFTSCSASDYGGAIETSADSITISSTTFENCSARYGGGITNMGGSTPMIISSTFSNCSAEMYGGAFFSGDDSPLAITSSVFSNCTGDNGPGAISTNSGDLTIISCIFTDCAGKNSFSGGISSTGTSTVTNVTFTNCSGDNGGAINAHSGDLTVSSSAFSNCSAKFHGGAVYSASGIADISSSSFSDCSANAGGAIYTDSGTLTVTSSDFPSCWADAGGSAIYGKDGDVTVRFSRIIAKKQPCCEDMIHNDGGGIDAANNWWDITGSQVHTTGGVTTEPWLVLNITASPQQAGPGENVEIRINLTNNSWGEDTTSGGVFVPDGIPVAYAVTSGPGSLEPDAGTLTGGTNTTMLTVESTGTSIVSAMVDGWNVTSSITGPEGIYTINPGDSIQDAINAAGSGDTIILNPGTYLQHDIEVTKNITLKASSPAGGTAANTIIDAENAGRILDDSGGYNLTIENLTFRNGYAEDGGAIIFGSLVDDTGSVSITSSSFNNCSATGGGGAIGAYKRFACCSQDPRVTILSSTFTNCSAGEGSAINAEGSRMNIHFSRFNDNNGKMIAAGAAGAANNWWGTNDDPSGLVSGAVTISPWLVLNISVTPSSPESGQASLIRVNLTNNSAGMDTTSDGIFVPDGIPVAFAVTGSTGSLNPQEGNITSGSNATVFTPAVSGTGTISSTVDDQVVSVSVNSVATLLPLPGSSQSPTDPDYDGLCEDLNGDGVADVTDVVLFFEETDWIAANEPVATFDFNNNGRIEFDDIVKLYEKI